MISFLKSAALTCAAMAVASTTVTAAPIVVDNFSFESAAIGAPGGVSSVHPGWTGGLVFRPTTATVPVVPDGLQVLFLQGAGASSTQTLSAVLTAGTTYTLLVDVGSRQDFNFIGTYAITLEGASGVLASTTTPTPANGSFVTASLSYAALIGDASLGQALTIRITHTGAGSSTGLFDNVRLDASPTNVPEPSSIGFVLLGLTLVAAKLRRANRGRDTRPPAPTSSIVAA